MTQESADRLLASRAAETHGLFTWAEALELGFTKDMIRKRVQSGRWERVRRNTYAVRGFPASWRRTALAAVLSCGAGAVASHATAGALWRAPGCAEGSVEVSVPGRRRVRTEGIIVHRPAQLSSVDCTIVDAIPVTTPPRTLLDLAAKLTADELEEILDDFLRRKLMTASWIRWRIDELSHPGRRGIHVLEAMCAAREDHGPELDSRLERKLERIIRRSGLPRPVRQHEVWINGKRYDIDFAYPDLMIAIEADGYESRASRRRWEAELVRQNHLMGGGWKVLRYTWAAVTQRPATIVAEIAEAIAERTLARSG